MACRSPVSRCADAIGRHIQVNLANSACPLHCACLGNAHRLFIGLIGLFRKLLLLLGDHWP